MINFRKSDKKIISSKVRVNYEDGITTYLYENGKKIYQIVEKSLEISPVELKKIRKTFPIGFTGEYFEKIPYNGKFDVYLPAEVDMYTGNFVYKEPKIHYLRYETLDENEIKEELLILFEKKSKELRLEYSYGDHFFEIICIKVEAGKILIERRIDYKQKALVTLSNFNLNKYEVNYDLIDHEGNKIAHSSYKVEKNDLDLVKLFAL